jgi:hypothetical protein
MDKLIQEAQEIVATRQKCLYASPLDFTAAKIIELLEFSRANNISDESWLPGTQVWLRIWYARNNKEPLAKLKLTPAQIAEVKLLASYLGIPYKDLLCGIDDPESEKLKRLAQTSQHL